MYISISVVPVTFVMLSGCLIYVDLQYRQRTGWKFGCIPYRRANKLRTSQENLNDEGSTCVDSTQEELNANDKIENIGPLINSTPLEHVDLFAFTDNNPLGSPFRDRNIARTSRPQIHVVLEFYLHLAIFILEKIHLEYCRIVLTLYFTSRTSYF